MGCDVEQARAMVYSDGTDLTKLEAAMKIGVSCRLCERNDCAQRAFPKIGRELGVNPNIKGLSTFGPVR